MPYRKPVEPIICEIEVPAKGYEWKRATAAGDAKPGWFLVERDRASLVRPYEPVKTETGLFRAFAALEPSRDSFLAFANRFGWLGGWEMLGGSRHGNPFELWNVEVARMRFAVELLDQIQAGDVKALAQRYRLIEGHKFGTAVWRDGAPVLFERESPAAVERFRAGNALDVALFDLQTIVNEKLVRYSSVGRLLSRPGEPDLGLYFVPRSLLACLWIQLARAAAGRKSYRQCDQCRKWFEVGATAGDRRTRSDRSYCSDACRARAYRERQEAAKAKVKKRSGRARRRQ